MSLSNIQYQRVLDSITRYYYSLGKFPSEEQLKTDLSKYFSRYSLGSPVGFTNGIFADGLRASADDMNDAVCKTISNLDILYETIQEQLSQSMTLNTYLSANLEKLKIKRRAIVAKIDEFLFSNANTDGYFYSFADTFDNLNYTDLSLTSAFVDIINGSVTLPVNSDATEILPGTAIATTQFEFFLGENSVQTGIERSPFSSCLDGLSNTYWSTEILSDSLVDATCRVTMTMPNSAVSEVEFFPYGTSPVQVLLETNGISGYRVFGSSIQEGSSRMVFSDKLVYASALRFTIKKKKPDYTLETESGTKYVYIFGAKDINIIRKDYVDEATWVSRPISISNDLSLDHVLDAVSLKVDENVLDNTFINYYVSLDKGISSPSMGDFDWKKITPMTESVLTPDMTVGFNGAATSVRFIRRSPTANNLQLLPEDSLNPDSRIRNPFTKDGIDLWRIADLGTEDPIRSTLSLEEGVNCLRVYHVDYQAGALSLSFWAPYVNGSKESEQIFSRIDTSNNFFWGGDIGENYKSVYMETLIFSDSDQNIGLKKFSKLDANSRLWDVHVHVNGSKVAELPVGVNEINIPWRFSKGLNHIALTLTIPRATQSRYPNEGSIELMEAESLYSYGSVKLANWSYVDIFQLLNNAGEDSNIFSIYKDGERTQIVSRKKPSNNYRLSYSTATTQSNASIRVRADLGRALANSSVSPSIDLYRVRFRYS